MHVKVPRQGESLPRRGLAKSWRILKRCMLLGRWSIFFFPVFLSERMEKTIRLPPGQSPKDKGRSEEVGSVHPKPVTGLLTAGNSWTGSVWGRALAQPGHTTHRSWLCRPQQGCKCSLASVLYSFKWECEALLFEDIEKAAWERKSDGSSADWDISNCSVGLCSPGGPSGTSTSNCEGPRPRSAGAMSVSAAQALGIELATHVTCWGCYNKAPRTAWLKVTGVLSHGFGSWDLSMSAALVPSEPWLQMVWWRPLVLPGFWCITLIPTYILFPLGVSACALMSPLIKTPVISGQSPP